MDDDKLIMLCMAIAAVCLLLSSFFSGVALRAEHDAHPDWPWALIEAHQLWLGMTEDQARVSVGRTLEVNTTTTPAGHREQWVYRCEVAECRWFRGYLYFVDGTLTAIQTG